MFDSILYTLDLFKTPVNFNINGQPKYSSIIGVLFSLTILTYVIYTIAIHDIFYQNNPKINTQNYVVPNDAYPTMYFNKYNFSVALGLQNYSGVHVVDYSYFAISMEITYSNNLNNNPTKPRVSYMKVCNESDFADPNMFYDNGLKNTFCLADDKTFKISGSFGSSEINYMIAKILPCTSQIEMDFNVTCKNQTMMDLFFSNHWLNAYIPNNNFNYFNKDHPVIPTVKYFDIHASAVFTKISTYYLQKTVITTNANIFQYSPETINTYVIGDIVNDFNAYVPKVSQDYASFIFFAQAETLSTQRNYSTIQDLLANIGGLLNTLVLVTTIFLSNYYKFSISKTIVNSIYKIGHNECPQLNSTYKIEENNKKTNYLINLHGTIPSMEMNMNQIPGIISKFERRIVETESQILMTKNENQPEELKKEPLKTLQLEKIMSNVSLKNNKNAEILKEIMTEIPEKVENKLQTDKIPIRIEENLEYSLKHIDITSPIEQTLNQNRKRSSLSKLKKLMGINKNNDKLSINYIKMILLKAKNVFTKKLNQDELLYLNSMKVYSENIDVLNLLKKIQELERLKYILLTPEQNAVFDLLDKNIFSERNCNFDVKKQKFERKKTNYCVLTKFYKENKNKVNLDFTSYRLLELIDAHLVN